MYVATAAATQNGVRTHLLVAPLPQSHQCEQVHLTQWNPIDSGTVAAAVAAPCERTFTWWGLFTFIWQNECKSDLLINEPLAIFFFFLLFEFAINGVAPCNLTRSLVTIEYFPTTQFNLTLSGRIRN